MFSPYFAAILLLITGIIADAYIIFSTPIRKRKTFRAIALWQGVFFNISFPLAIFISQNILGGDSLTNFTWIFFSFLLIYIPKYVYITFDIIANIPRLFRHRKIQAITKCGLVISVIAFISILWGAKNRYNIDIQRIDIVNNCLPKSFDGIIIAQISDLHLGSYCSDTTFVAKLVDKINALHPDIIVFTGDLVNRITAEAIPFQNTLSKLQAPLGVYSILGNHDYGDYYTWNSEIEKADNLQALKDFQKKIGWQLLNNETTFIHHNGDSIAIIGVENIGEPPFKNYGDLNKAYATLDDTQFKILLSHNPSHWAQVIKNYSTKNIALTLSGHTHAMQMSLGRKISPAALKYPYWGGMYTDDLGRSLYVNFGIGTVGIPARIGATPEITIFTLKANSTN